MNNLKKYIRKATQYLEITWLAACICMISVTVSFANPISSNTNPILNMEKEIYYHPNEFLTKVENRFDELGYGKIEMEYPAKENTLLRLQYLADKLSSMDKIPNLSDQDFRKTWKKEGTVDFLTDLYYWLHGNKVSLPENGLDDAWYNVSTHFASFERSLSSLKDKE